MKDEKNLGLQGQTFSVSFSSFYFKKDALTDSHLTVTLQIVNNNCRSVSSIGFVHVQMILQQVCYSSDDEIEHDFIAG